MSENSIWDGDFYHLEGNSDERGAYLSCESVARQLEILDQQRVKKPKGYRAEQYLQEASRMFAT